MTEDDILALVENLEETAIEYGENRYRSGVYTYNLVAIKCELQDAKDKLKTAIKGLYNGIAKTKTDD